MALSIECVSRLDCTGESFNLTPQILNIPCNVSASDNIPRLYTSVKSAVNDWLSLSKSWVSYVNLNDELVQHTDDSCLENDLGDSAHQMTLNPVKKVVASAVINFFEQSQDNNQCNMCNGSTRRTERRISRSTTFVIKRASPRKQQTSHESNSTEIKYDEHTICQTSNQKVQIENPDDTTCSDTTVFLNSPLCPRSIKKCSPKKSGCRFILSKLKKIVGCSKINYL